MTCFCTCCDETVLLLLKTVLLVFWLFFFYSLGFVDLEELVTDDQSLLRISIALRACVVSLFDVIVDIVLLTAVRLGNLLCALFGVQVCLMKNRKILVILSQYHNCQKWIL